MIGGAKGIGIGIDFGIPNQYCRATSKPYIEKDVLDSLRVVASAYGKSNDDPDRAVVKNLVDPDNPFVISNAAYTEGSGYADKGSPYYGAFVTDGIDDLITSTKTVQEMGITNKVTVISMIHQTGLACKTNFICDKGSYWRCNEVANTGEGKTGIYGYTSTNNSINIINNILGDKNDYSAVGDKNDITPSQFSVVGYIGGSTGKITYTSSVAWYWTIIANKVLTTDQINQVIAYFNLDRTLNPDILCNTIKQGITNENHEEFGDKLIDFSGNGRDIQLNNIAWKGDSGIGKYEVDFLDSSIWNSSNSTITSSKIDCKNAISHIMLLYYSVGSKEYPDIPSFKVIKTGADIDYSYINETGSPKSVRIVDGVNVLPASHNTLYSGSGRFCGFGNLGMGNSVTITQIPSHAGGLCLDGVNDFGKVTGMPIYKDYTIVVDYERISGIEQAWAEALISKSYIANQGAFVLMETNGMAKHSYSFGTYTTFNKDDSTRTLLYQSKYKCGDVDLNAGTGIDGDTLWLGTYRDNYSSFFNGAIYSLMSFPYSMSKFLIERQLKKHKLGTLYPNMVEFRPVINSNIDIKKINYWDKGQNILHIGDYVSIGNDVKTNITVPNGYKISKVTSNAFDNITIEKSSTEFIYDVKFYGIKKSPQKINLTIEQDENYVLFNPIIKSNVEYHKLDFYLNNYEKRINIGDYIPKDAYLRANFYLKNNVDELTVFTFNGVNIGYRRSIVGDTAFNIGHIYNYDSPQEVNITIDEYIRYEDIVQPYPVLLRFSDENGNEVSWGGKVKLGSSITRIGSFNDCNLLKGIYTVNNAKLNGSPLPSTPHVVERQMVFTCTATYLLDNNEPKCILSPSRLRIPNSSYKLFGYIPDISGHGNHGVIHNSAYAEGSGVNEDGSYQFDGVDDFVTIPTLSSGGKQVLMKVNWNTIDSIIYDQRGINGFAIYCSDYNTIGDSITVPAYKGRNAAGTTYIDGIRNEYIIASQLRNVTHNIVEILDTPYAAGNINPIIGKSYMYGRHGSLALYDFMLFDEISTDDKIKQLNEYVGIEAKVELPPYYWDAYGKTNLDADKATIQQRGVAVGDYDLTNYNHAYDKMSSYGGYEFAKFDNTLDWYNTEGNDSVEVVSRNGHSITLKRLTGSNFWYFQNSTFRGLISNVIPFKVNSNKNIAVIWDVHGLSISEGKYKSAIVQELVLNPNEDNYTNLKTLNEEELAQIDISTNSLYYLLWFDLSTLAVNEEVTIEMLPLYPNGLVYDGVTNYSKNANIPALDDFTAIIKREWLKKQGCPLIKGSKVYEGGNGNALLLEWDKAYNFVFYKRTDIMEGELPDNISFITPTNYNGNVITRGSEQDTNGICIAGDGNAGFANMVFYKLILYPKTIPLLQINFLKNLMEKDEIIDLNNPIFIK